MQSTPKGVVRLSTKHQKAAEETEKRLDNLHQEILNLQERQSKELKAMKEKAEEALIANQNSIQELIKMKKKNLIVKTVSLKK